MNTENINLWHVANAGIVLKMGNLTIGIDILCEQIKPYRLTPQEIENQVLDTGLCPKLDYLIITHEHEDHFSKPKVIEFLNRQPQVIVISNRTVIEELRRYIDYSRLIAVEKNKSEKFKIHNKDIEIEIFHSTHMGALYKDIVNLCTIIHWRDRKILIPGDAEPRELLTGENIQGEKMDYLVVPFPYITLNSVRKIVKENVRPDFIFVFHLPSEKYDKDGLIQQSQDIYINEGTAFPRTVFGKHFGVKYNFE